MSDLPARASPSLSAATRRTDRADFSTWRQQHGQPALPTAPATLAAHFGHILKRRAEAAGLTVGAREGLSAPGLRAGFVTEACRAGARDAQIMAHTRHRGLRTMRGHVGRAKPLTGSPVRLLGP